MTEDWLQNLRVSKAKATIQIDRESHADFVKACASMPQSPPLGRVAAGLVRWFARRSEAVKTAVISGVDEGMERLYAQALRETADELERGAIKRVGVIKQKEPVGKSREKPAEALPR